MRRTEFSWLAFAVAAFIITGCSRTESTKPDASEPAGRPAAVGAGGAGANLNDEEFVRDVALKHMAELELSRMALEKATNPDVKSFARRMLDDHGAERDLQSVVSAQGIEWPPQLDDKHKKTAEELAEKQGADFDREYVKAMIEGHQNLAAKLESRLDVQSLAAWKTAAAGRTESKALPEPGVALQDVEIRPIQGGTGAAARINQWAADRYPVAQKHLDSARALEAATKKPLTN